MGVWGAGNFASDAALDNVHELVDSMVQQVAETVASEHGTEPDERSSTVMLCNVELMFVIGRHVGISMVRAAAVESWKEKYLGVWDAYIDGLKPVPGFKEERRRVIVEMFDRLIALCRQREGWPSGNGMMVEGAPAHPRLATGHAGDGRLGGER